MGQTARAIRPPAKNSAPEISTAPTLAKMSDTELFDVTKKGKGKMPGYDKKIAGDQIKELVKFVRSLN
jgi:hypothetical protein